MTIIPIRNLKIQVPQGKKADIFQEFHQILLEQVCYVIGRFLEEAMETEVERWLGRKSHVRRRRVKGQEVSIRYYFSL